MSIDFRTLSSSLAAMIAGSSAMLGILLGLLGILLGILGIPVSTSRSQPADEIRLRRPIALALVDDGFRLAIANRDSGSLQIVNTRTRAVESEQRIGQRLADLIVTPDLILAIDEVGGELVSVSQGKVIGRRNVGMSPAGIRLTEDGKTAVITLLWPRRLALVPLDEKAPIATIDLPFAPRRLLLVGSKAIVADAFGGELGVVDLEKRSIVRVRSLGVQNIRGLTLDPAGRHLYLTHQTLNPSTSTQKGEIQNGNVVNNKIRKISLPALIEVSSRQPQEEHGYSIGDIEQGAGDPAGLVIDSRRQALVALAGVDEFAIGRIEEVIWTRLTVGRRPTAVAFDSFKRLAYVANTFSDSISIIDVAAAKVVGEISLGKPAALEPYERGELLYHDARRSHLSWMSCQSCHPDGHTTGGLNDNFSDGSFGSPKRVLSLLGVKDTAPWAWNGKIETLEDQVRNSFQSTMHGTRPTSDEVHDVTAYLRTLTPPPSLTAARGISDGPARERGRKLFETLNCTACHKPPLFTSPKTYDVGLGAEGDKFSPPSLRGVSQGGPYFHDNRAATLAEVLSGVRHQLARPLSVAEQADLEAFLKGL